MQHTWIADEPIEGTGAWTLDDPDGFEFLRRNTLPRPGSILQALKADFRDWQVIRYWAIGLVMATLGVGTVYFSIKTDSMVALLPGLFAAFMGGRLLFVLLRLFLIFERNLRCGPILQGEIPSLGRNSPVRGISIVTAQLSDGRSIVVAMKIAPTLAAVGGAAPAEVLILADPDERQGSVIGIRPILRNRAEADATRPST